MTQNNVETKPISVADSVRVGSIVEFLHDNLPQQAWVLECEDSKVRLLTLQARELNVPFSRVLPWVGPHYDGQKSKEEIIALLRVHHNRRVSLSGAVNPELLWELSLTEKEKESASWFAELVFSNIASNWFDDGVAAVGQVLLQAKNHFKFNSPFFDLYSQEQVDARTAKQKAADSKAILLEQGQNFFKSLWEVHLKRRTRAEVLEQFKLDPGSKQALLRVLQELISAPQQKDTNQLWKQLSKSLGDGQHLALFIATAWGLVPEHYNFLFDRADYSPQAQWHKKYAAELDEIKAAIARFIEKETPVSDDLSWANLVSIDSPSTKDIDDALSVEKLPNEAGFKVRIALACPALFWNFNRQSWQAEQEAKTPSLNSLGVLKDIFPKLKAQAEPETVKDNTAGETSSTQETPKLAKADLEKQDILDRKVMQRASSVYLPEGSFHMLPEELGTSALSLEAKQKRPALLAEITLDINGKVLACLPSFGTIKVADRLSFVGCEAVLEQLSANSKNLDCPNEYLEAALPYSEILLIAENLAKTLRAKRIENGAVIIEKPDQDIKFNKTKEQLANPYLNSLAFDAEGELRCRHSDTPVLSSANEAWNQLEVEVSASQELPRAQLVVGELMILVNTALAEWGKEHNIPMLYRTQDLDVPKEFAGEWTAPADIARVVKGLSAAQLETNPKPHVGIGAKAYASFSSPLRRYVDLVNEYQVLAHLSSSQEGKKSLERPLEMFSLKELDKLLSKLHFNIEATTQIQRSRTRYLKLLAIQQQGEQFWHDAIITDIRDPFVFVSLNLYQIIVRGRRPTFGSNPELGKAIKVRLGKISPLNNEITIFATEATERPDIPDETTTPHTTTPETAMPDTIGPDKKGLPENAGE